MAARGGGRPHGHCYLLDVVSDEARLPSQRLEVFTLEGSVQHFGSFLMEDGIEAAQLLVGRGLGCIARSQMNHNKHKSSAALSELQSAVSSTH